MSLKSLIVSCTLLGVFLFSSGIQAQTAISTHGPLTIEACVSFPSVSTSIPYSLTISETTSDGFAITSGSKTFQIALPENFTFSGTVSFSETGDDISSISANIDSDARYILVTYTTTATNTLDVITLSGLSVVAASAAQSGNVTYLAGTAVINGLTSGDLFFPIASASASINVTGGTLSATQTYCLDEPSSVLTVSGGTTSATTSNVLTYQWESGPNDSSFSSLDTHTGPTYQPLTNLVGTTFYRRKITETSNGLSCVAYSSVVSVSVKTLDAGEISGTEEVCYNGVPGSITSVRDASVEGEVVTYDWEQSIDNGVSWTTAPSTNSTTYVFGSNTLTQTTQFRRIAFSTSCTVTKSTNIITKTAFGPLDGGTITPTIQLLYKGTTPASLTVSSTTNSGNVSGTLSYQWQQSTDSVNFTNIDNSTADTYLPSATQTGTTYFKRLTKLTNGSVICEEESTVGSVTVYDLNPGSIIGDQSLCNDHLASDITSIGSVDGNVSPPDAGNSVTYTWESSLDNVAWSTMGGETSTTLDFTNALTQTTYYKRIASIDAGTVTRSTNVIAKTLLLAVVGGTMDTVSTTLCVGEALPNLTVSGSTATGGPTYQWEYSSDNSNFSTLDGVTGAAHTPTQTATGTHYFRRITTVTSSGVACSATSSVTAIIIKGLSPGSIGSEQNICYNDTPNELTSTSAANAAGDPITYTWQTAAANSGPWSTASGTSSSTTYQPAALTQTTFYRRLANSTSCSISATTNIIKINVVPAVVGGTMATVSETICVGSTPTELVVNGATSAGVLTYQWETSSDNNTFSTITGATSINYTPVTPTAAGTTYYRRQITLSSDGGFCSATSSVTTLIAKGITSGTIGSDKTVCYNTTGGLLTSLTAADASGETPLYSWQKSIDSGSNWTVIGSASDPTYTVGTITQTTQFRRLASSPTCTVSATTTPITITVLTEVVGGTASGNQSVCVDATPLALSVTGHTSSGGTLSYQWQSSSSVATNTFVDINLSSAINEQYTPPTDATGTVYYRRITNITTGGETCFAASSVVSVTVTDVLGGVQATPSQTVCSGSPVTDLTITGGSGLAGEVYQWQMSRTDTASNSFTNLSGVTGAVYTPSNTQTGTTYYRRVTSVTGSSCVAYSDAATVIIVDFTPGVIASNETLCYGGTASSITVATPAAVIGGTEAISYTWQQKIGAGAWTTAVGTSNGSTYSPGTLTQTTKYRRVVSIASCTATKTTNEITKTVLAELTAGTADTATQTVCLNDTRPVLAITGGSGSTTYQWQSSSTTGTGFTNISGATNSSYQAPTDVAGTTYYRRLITQSQGGKNCNATSTEFEVIVAAINAGSISGAATVCYNGDGGTIGSTLDASLGTDVISYTWQKSINAGGDWMVVSGQTSTTIAVGTLTQTSLFRRVALGTTCTVTATTSAVQITVVPEVLGGTASGNQTLCVGATPASLSVTGASTSGGDITYRWQSSATNVSAAFTNATTGTGTNTATYIPSTTATGTVYYRRVTNITAGGETCFAASSVVSVTVTDVLGGVQATPSQTVCSGSPVADLTISGGSGLAGEVYQWQMSRTDTASNSFTNLSGFTGAVYTPSNTQTGTTYYRRITSVTGSSCVAYSDAATVIVVDFTPGVITSNETLCYGGTASSITVATPAAIIGGTETISYTWQQQIGGGAWSTAVGTSNDSTYSPGTLTQTTKYRRVVSIASCTATQTTNEITKTVLAELVAGTADTATQTLCVDSTRPTLNITGSSGGTTYQWQSSSTTGTGFTNISDATNSSYQAPTNVAGTTYYRRLITQSQGAANCNATSTEFEVIVAAINAGSISGAATVCYNGDGGTIGSTLDASLGTDVISYTWQKSDNAGGNWTTVSGQTSTTIAVGTLTQTSLFRRVALGTTCTVTATTSAVQITVVPEVLGGTASGNQTLCVGATPASLSVTGASTSGGDITYRWQSSATNVSAAFTNATTGTGTNTATYIPSTTATGTVYYRRVTNITAGGETCFAASSVVSVTVTDVLGGVQATPSQTVCSGSPVADLTISGGSGLAGEVYQWQMSRTDTASNSFTNLSGVTGASYTPSNTQTGTTYYRRITSVTGSSCVAYSDAATVIVKDFTPGVIASNETLCYGGAASSITEGTPAAVIGGTESISYTWQQQIGGGAWSTAVGTSNGSTYNPGTLTQTTKYRRVVSIASCTATQTTNEITKTVLAELIAGTATTATQTLCVDSTRPTLAVTGSSGGTTYQWQSSSTSGTGFTNISGATTSAYDAPTDVAGTKYYIRLITQSQGGKNCNASSSEFEVIVAAINAGSISGAATVCYNGDGGTIGSTLDASLGTDVISYTWQKSINVGGDWTVVSGQTSTTIAVGTLTQTSLFRRVALGTTCTVTATTSAVQITVVPEVLGGTASGDQTLCVDATPASLSVTGASTSGGDITYRWQSSATNVSAAFTNATTGSGITSETYIPSTTVTGTVYYRRVTNITAGGETCFAASSVVSVTVTDVLGGVQVTPSQTVCSGSPVTDLTISGGSGLAGEVYQWQISRTDTASNSFTNLSGFTGAVYTPSNTQTGTTYYRRVTSVTGSSCVAYSDAATVIVVDFTPGVITSNETLCYGGTAFSITVATPAAIIGGTETISYTWQQQIGGGAWSTAVGTSNGSTYSPGTLTQTTKYRRVVSIASCTATQTTNEITKTVLDEVDGGTFNSAVQIVCQGEVPTALTITSTTSAGSFSITPQYSWQQSPDSNLANFTEIGGTAAANETYIPTTTVTGTTYFRRATKLTLNDQTCIQYSDIQLFTVIGLDPGDINGGQDLCYGEPLGNITPIGNLRSALVTPSTAGETITYVFQQSTDEGSNWSQIQTGVNPSYSFTTTLTQTTWFRRLASTPNCSNTVTSSVVIKNVTSELIGGTITADQTICVGETPTTLTVTTATNSDTVSGTLSYKWQSSTTNIPANFQDLADDFSDSETYVPANSSTATGTTYYRRKISIAGSSCEVFSAVSAVTVVGITAGTITGTQTICYQEPVTIGSALGASTSGGVAETLTYTWQQQINGGAWNNVNGAGNNPTLVFAAGVLTQTTSYKRVALSTACATNSATTNIIEITVLPEIIGGTVRLTNPADPTTICAGVNPGVLIVINGTNTSTANIRFQWYKKTSAGDAYATITGAVSDNYDSGTLTQTTYFKRAAYFDENTSCSIDSNELLISVAIVNAGTITGTQVICESDTNIALGSVTGASVSEPFTYTWERTDATGLARDIWSNIADATSASYTIPSAPASNTVYYRRATNVTGQNCPGYSNIVTIRINRFEGSSGITFNGINNNIQICGSATIPSIGGNGAYQATGVITYKWEISQDNTSNYVVIAGQTSSVLSAAAIADQVASMGGAQKDYFFRRTTISTLDGKVCEVVNLASALYGPENLSVNPGTVNINLSAGQNNLTEQVICIGGTPAFFSGNTATASITNVVPSASVTVTYQWYKSTNNYNYALIDGATDESYQSGALNQTTYFRRGVLPDYPNTSCMYWSSNTLQVIVARDYSIKSNSNQTIVCAGDDLGRLVTAVVNIPAMERDAMSFKWYKKAQSEDSFSLITGQNAETLAPDPITETTTFRREITVTISGTDSPTCNTGPFTADYTLTVNHADPGEIIYNGTLRAGTTDIIDVCYGADHAGFNSNGAKDWDVFGEPVFEWYTSSDGVDYSSVNVLTETYPASTITQTIWIKRRISSVYTYTIDTNVVTSTCTGVSTETSFTNIFKINVLPRVEKPTLTATVNAQICATNLSPGSITISNMYSPTSDGVVYEWYTSKNKTTWESVKNPLNLTEIYGGETLILPQLLENTYYEVRSYVLSDTLCRDVSDIFEVNVINITPGVIAFTTPTAQENYYQICDDATPVLTITAKSGFNHSVYPNTSTFTVTWQSKPKDGVSGYTDITFNDQLSSPTFATLTARNMTESIYIRKKIAVLNDAGDILCEEFTNGVLIDYMPEPVVNIPDPSIFVTDPSCFDGTDGSITINPTAITGGTPTDRAQSVRITLSGSYSTTATFRTTIAGINYDFTATASNTSINSITASITAVLTNALSNTLDITSVNNLITLTAKDATQDFSIQTTIINNTKSIFNLEYLDTRALANSYSWKKFTGDTGTIVDSGFTNPGTLNLTALAAGRYELTVTNNLDCTAVTVSPTFNLINPNPIVAGTLTSSLGDLVCEGAIPLLSVPGLTLPPNPIYIWERSLNGTNNWTVIKDGVATVTTATYSVSTTLTQTTYFRRGINSNLSAGVNCAPAYSFTEPLKIEINIATPGTIQYAGNSDNGVIEVCYNTAPLEFSNGATPYTVSGAASFEWYQSIDSGNTWALIPNATEQAYTPTALTQTTQFRRKVRSNILVGTVTLTCDDSNEEDNFSNSFTVAVKEDIPTPAVVSSVNTVCASDLSRGLLSIDNITAVDAVAGIEKQWERFTTLNGWVPIRDENGNIENGNTYRLPTLTETTRFRVLVQYTATGVNSATCVTPSNAVTVTVINIDPGTISFLDTPVVENVYNTCTSLANPIVLGANGAGNQASVPDHETTYESFWETKDTSGTGVWSPLALSGNYSGSDRNRVLTISNALAASIYVRRGIRQEITPGSGIFCTEYSNVVLINLLDAPVVTIPDPAAALITVPSCPGDSDGAITISPTAITGGSQTAQAQKVNLELSGAYTQAGIYTPTGRYEVTINSTTYSYTATASNTTLESLTASITAAIGSGPLVAVSSSGKIITLTASNTAEPFTVSTNITNLGTQTRFRVEYVTPALSVNTYKWEKLLGAVGTAVDNTVTLSNTLSLTGLNAGRYRLTVTNNTTCASTEAPIFSVVDKTIVPGTITANTGNVLCTDHSGFTLTVTGDSSNIGETYLWQQSTDGVSGWTNVLSGTSSITTATATIGLLTDTTFFRRGVRIENAGVPCTATYSYTPNYEMVINKSTPGAIATEELLVCAGSVPSIPISESAAPSNNSRGVITYMWESKADSPSSDWTTVAGASASSLSLTTPINLTTAFRRLVINTIDGVACNSIPSNVVTITTVTPTTIDNATIRTSRILNVSCNGLSDGSINVALTDFTTDHPSPTFTWKKVGDPSFKLTTMAATALGAGTYNLTISTYTNTIAGVIVPVCQAVSENFIITAPTPLTFTVSATCEGNIVATGAGGLENYIYTLTAANQAPTSVAVTGGGPHTFLNLIKGATYTVTLAENGTRVCAPISEAVTMPTDLIIDTAKITTEAATCFGINDGSIAVEASFVSGGTARYSYEWTGPAGATYFTREINNLSPGQYTLVVTDALGCTATFNTTIDSKAVLEISREVVTNETLSCSDSKDASIEVEVTPLDRNVSYLWTLGGTSQGTNSSISNLGPGTYVLTITDLDSPNGACQIVKTYIISAPSALAVQEDSVVSPLCFSENGGSVTYTVSGGTAPYFYSIDGGAQVSFGTSSDTSVTKVITGIGDGAHAIIFSDSNASNCATGGGVVTKNVTISIPVVLEVEYSESADLVPIPCGGSGSIKVTASGGTGSYSYQWTGPNLNRITSTNSLDVSVGGSYTVVVTDANQCTKSVQITVPDQEGRFTVTGTVNQQQCAKDASDASISLSVSATAVAPLTISWQKWTLKAAAGGVVSTTTSTCTTNCYEWANIVGSEGQLLLNNLSVGEYRVTVSDSNTSGCNTIVRTFSIAASNLELYSTRVIPPSCEVETGAYVFKLKHTNPIKFFLNGTEVTVGTGTGTGTLKYNNSTEQYTIPGLLGGAYLLRILEQIPSGSNTTDGCEVFENFTLGSFEAISYQGDTDLMVDVCSPDGTTFPDPALVSGGVPFVNASQESYYIYRWTGITTDSSAPATSTVSSSTSSPTGTGTAAASATASGTVAYGSISLLSTTPVALAPGEYNLVIEDSQGCLSDPIPFLIEANVKPISVTVATEELNCGLNNTDGAFRIAIEGGAAPYTITWEKEIPGDETDPNPTYELIATNVLNLNNLGEGRYRLKITSGVINCENDAAREFTAMYSLFKSDTITILDGPFLSRELCVGDPGTLDIKVFDNQSEAFSFRYAGELVTGTFIGEDTYRVVIASPQEEAILDIVNDRGCAVQVPIITGVGEPDFSYTSLSLEQSNTLIPNQDITFTNTSEDLYTKLQFNFGDGSPVIEVTAENEATTDIVHRYKTPGTFYVTMRFYNSLGCYKETEQEVIVGRGYLVIFPTAFSPNADGVNDMFFGEYTGLTAFNFEVFDMWGNLIYSKIIEDVTLKEAWGWDGNYATGEPYPYQTFRYVFTGTTYSEKTVVESGEVTLLR